jgi:hypothetical protein
LLAQTTQRYIVAMNPDATGAKRAAFADRITEEFSISIHSS